MKTLSVIPFGLLFLVTPLYSQPGQIYGPSMNQRSGVTAPNPLNQPAQSQPELQNFVARDPIRIIGGKTERVNGNGWFWFEGKVVEVQPAGIRVLGLYTNPGGNTERMMEVLYEPQEFFVQNFPYSVAEDDRLSMSQHYTAKISDNYTYTTVLGGSRTIHSLNYGVIWTPPPPTPEQIAEAKTNAIAARAKADAAKKAAEEKALKMNQDLAAKGDAYGLLRMGERYRDGTAVEKDLSKAREYFTNAIAAGSLDASNELARLPQNKP